MCRGVKDADYLALTWDPAKTGYHCAAHKAAFHEYCPYSYHCCDE